MAKWESPRTIPQTPEELDRATERILDTIEGARKHKPYRDKIRPNVRKYAMAALNMTGEKHDNED